MHLAIPHDVQDDVSKSRIAVVSVRVPAGHADVHFQVAGARSGVADLNDRVTKIRTALRIRETGMKQPDTLAFQRLQLIAAETLMLLGKPTV